MENSTYKVFVSSTKEDMQPYRDAMERAIIRAGCVPVGMKYFGAASVPPLLRCFEELESCQIYVCALGMRYGSVDQNTKKSYTQLEYERAVELGIPILAFLIDEDHMKFSIHEFDTDRKRNKLNNFKMMIKNNTICDFFDSPASLEIRVYQALINLINKLKIEVSSKDISAYRELLKKIKDDITNKRKGDMYQDIDYINRVIYPFIRNYLVKGCSQELLEMAYELTDIYDHVSEYEKAAVIKQLLYHLIDSKNKNLSDEHLRKLIGCTYSVIITKTDDVNLKEKLLEQSQKEMDILKDKVEKWDFDNNYMEYFIRGLFESNYGALMTNWADYFKNTGNVEQESYYLQEALEHQKKGEEIRKETLECFADEEHYEDAERRLYQSRSNIAGILFRMRQYREALEMHREILQQRIEKKETTNIYLTKSYMIGCYIGLRKNRCISKEDEEICIEYLDDCERFYKEHHDDRRLQEIQDKEKEFKELEEKKLEDDESKEQKQLTGYPSKDKPWLKYYSEEQIQMPIPECTMYELVYQKNQNNLEDIAISYYGTNFTYSQMFEEISLMAGTLEKEGIQSGDIITICMINSPETIFLLFALNKIGAVANMVYGSGTKEELIRCIEDAKSKIVFTLDIFQDKFREMEEKCGVQKVVVTSLSRSVLSENRADMGKMGLNQFPIPDESVFMIWEDFFRSDIRSTTIVHDFEASAVITYTGGTTGGSKGVILSNRACIAPALQYAEEGVKRGNTWVQLLPLFIAYGVTGSLMTPLAVGGVTLIVRIPMGDTILDLCKKFRPNHIWYGPAYWEKFSENKEKIDLSHLIAPISGGDRLSPSIEKKINRKLQDSGCKYPIMNGYGMTEAGAAVCVNYKRAYKFGTVGVPFVKNIISAFDTETGEELTYGKEGELCIHTPSMMIGYINNPKETKNVIKKHEDGKFWVHTGDLGYIDEEGFVYISGRLKRYMLCIVNGVQKKVFSLDIEKVLLANDFVNNCAVVPVPDKTINEVPVAFVISNKIGIEREMLEAELKEYCEQKLQEVYRPVKWYFVDAFPLTKVGKVDYRKLEEMAKK